MPLPPEACRGGAGGQAERGWGWLRPTLASGSCLVGWAGGLVWPQWEVSGGWGILFVGVVCWSCGVVHSLMVLQDSIGKQAQDVGLRFSRVPGEGSLPGAEVLHSHLGSPLIRKRP